MPSTQFPNLLAKIHSPITAIEYVQLRQRALETLIQCQKRWTTATRDSIKFDKATKDVQTALDIYDIILKNRPSCFLNHGWPQSPPQLPGLMSTNSSLSLKSDNSTLLITPASSLANSPKMSGWGNENPNKGVKDDIQEFEDLVLVEVKSPVPQAYGVI